MSTSVFEGPAIIVGYAYTLQIEAASAIFPEGSAFTAQVRSAVTSETVLTTLTTAGGGLVRVSDTALEIKIGASATGQMPIGRVIVDVIRTDVEPDQHMSFFLEIPVMQPVTRGL